MNRNSRTGIAVVGSANMDVVFSTARIPAPGETLLADSSAKYAGGKGLNQAVASARAGAHTSFIGALGLDQNGDDLLVTMTDSNIAAEQVRRVPQESGQAFIVVANNAENTIIVASGANETVVALTARDRAIIESSAVLLMQLELPLSVVMESARIARAAGTVVILNAAPAQELPAELVDNLDYLVVNEHESCLIGESDDLETASNKLANRVDRVVVTLGAEGSALYEHGLLISRIPAIRVEPVDTTGAGDTYCGAFAAAIAKGGTIVAAAKFATAAAALSVQVLGAVPSIPTLNRIEAMLSDSQGANSISLEPA